MSEKEDAIIRAFILEHDMEGHDCHEAHKIRAVKKSNQFPPAVVKSYMPDIRSANLRIRSEVYNEIVLRSTSHSSREQVEDILACLGCRFLFFQWLLERLLNDTPHDVPVVNPERVVSFEEIKEQKRKAAEEEQARIELQEKKGRGPLRFLHHRET